MRQNVNFKERVERDYRKRIIIDKDNPILAFKALRDRYGQRQGHLAGLAHLGSNASEDALSWNVFRILYQRKKLSYFLKPYKLGRIRSVAIWSLTPDVKYRNKDFQFCIGETIRSYDGILGGQTTEPDIIVLGSNGLCVIECKLGIPDQAVSHLWAGPYESVKKRLPVYRKAYPAIKAFLNEESAQYYQLIRMAFYAVVLARQYKVKPYLLSLANARNWDISFGRRCQSPADIWQEFIEKAGDVFPELSFDAVFWQDLIKISQIKRVDPLYRYLKHHPCL